MFAKTSGTVTTNAAPVTIPENSARRISAPVLFVCKVAMSQWYGHPHSQNPSDMGIPCNPNPNPNPKSLRKDEKGMLITANYNSLVLSMSDVQPAAQ